MHVSLVAEGLGKQIISGDASLGDRLMLLGGGTIIMAMSGLSLVVKSPHSEPGEPFLPVVKVANYWQVCLATLIFRENKSSSGTNVFLGDC